MTQPPRGAYLPALKDRHPSVGAERLRSSIADWSAALAAVSDMPSAVRQDVLDALDLARRFNAEVVRPMALAIDRQAELDPHYLPTELLRAANEWGLFTLWLPSLFGGKGWNFLSLYAFLEEVASACAGTAAAIGVHYMGLGALMASWNLRLAARVAQEVCAGERRGEPCLISLALNEPDAGSDVTDTALLPRARLASHAARQPDGSYVLNGAKSYISNGHVCRWHMVVAYEDLQRGAETMTVLAVRADSPGVQLGTLMDKVGQRACVASELRFVDVPVPAHDVAIAPSMGPALDQPYREVAQTLLDYIGACTRAGVGAFAAGVARGAFEAARDHAVRKLVPGGRLIERQSVQSLLAEMNQNASMARLAYVEASLANGMGGLFQTMFFRPLYWADQLAPALLWRLVARRVLRSAGVGRWFQRRFLARHSREWLALVSGLASMAKVGGAGLALANVDLAIDLIGPDALRRETGIDKRLRDAKLLQIYEGTDQLNRINLFKCRVRPDRGVRVFEREDSACIAPEMAVRWPSDVADAAWRAADALAPSLAPASGALASLQARPWADLHGEALCATLEALAAHDAGVALLVFASAAAHQAVRRAMPAQANAPLRRDLAGQWLAWPAFHALDEQLWPAVDAQGYLRGQADMLVTGRASRWAVLPVQGRDQSMQLAVVDLSHPAVIRGEALRTLGVPGATLEDIEFGGVPCELLGQPARTVMPALQADMAAAAIALQAGLGRAALAEAMAYARTREQGGGVLTGWGEVRRLLALQHERLAAVQALLHAAMSGRMAAGALRAAAMQAGALAGALTVDAAQLMGGEGYRRGSPAARRMLDARQLRGLSGGVAARRQSLLDPV